MTDEFECDNCGERFSREEAIRTKTMGGLDAKKWQTLNCPVCGTRVKTVYVGDE